MLKYALPAKEEHVIFVRMSKIQNKLYSAFMESLQEESLVNMVSMNPLKAFSVCCKVRPKHTTSILTRFLQGMIAALIFVIQIVLLRQCI